MSPHRGRAYSDATVENDLRYVSTNMGLYKRSFIVSFGERNVQREA